MEYQGLYFGIWILWILCITMDRALMLYRKGLRYFSDNLTGIREGMIFLEWEEARAKFSFAAIYYDFWAKVVEFYGPFHDRMLSQD